MLERSGALERAIQGTLMGEPGGKGSGKGQGQGEGEGLARKSSENGKEPGGGGTAGRGLREAILARLAAMGGDPGDPKGQPGSGPHIPDRHNAHRDPLSASGSLRAPSQVGEGERAIQAIHGLGRGADAPPQFREVFPSYDAAAEEGMADERIPAARRRAVKTYFESIRPQDR